MIWTIDTELSDHDDVKRGVVCTKVSRVHLSIEEFPDPVDAKVCAALLSMSIHGGMATSVTHCL